MWIWIGIGIVAYWIWKKPGGIARLANDSLKFELFKELRARGKERESREIPSVEEMEVRFTRRIIAITVAMIAISTIGLWHVGPMVGVLIGSLSAALFAITAWSVTSHTRNVVLPLYLTLCRMPGSRWDPRANPRRWIQVRRGNTRVIRVRLPKDWHASAMGVKMIEEIVKQRVPGEWKCRVDRPKFIMVFTPTAAIAIDVGAEEERAPVPVNLEKEEIEIESKTKSPW